MEFDPSKPFKKPEDLDTKGWDIDFSQLEVPKMRFSQANQLFESPNKKFALCFYAVNEYKMGWEGGPIAIYENKESPKLLSNPQNTTFEYRSNYTLIPDNEFFFVVLHAYHDKNKNLSNYPMVVIDLERKRFGFIDLENFTAIYYTPVRVSNSVFRLQTHFPVKGRLIQTPDRTDELIDLKALTYYDLSYFNNVASFYHSIKAKTQPELNN